MTIDVYEYESIQNTCDTESEWQRLVNCKIIVSILVLDGQLFIFLRFIFYFILKTLDKRRGQSYNVAI